MQLRQRGRSFKQSDGGRQEEYVYETAADGIVFKVDDESHRIRRVRGGRRRFESNARMAKRGEIISKVFFIVQEHAASPNIARYNHLTSACSRVCSLIKRIRSIFSASSSGVSLV
jgi:hypothetical protein